MRQLASAFPGSFPELVQDFLAGIGQFLARDDHGRNNRQARMSANPCHELVALGLRESLAPWSHHTEPYHEACLAYRCRRHRHFDDCRARR